MLVNNKGQFSEHWTMKDSTVVNGDASFGDLDNDDDDYMIESYDDD